MVTITVHTPSPVAVPRGAALAANLMSRVLNWLEAVAERRATAALRRNSDRRGIEAARLRRYAQTWVSQDPRFAADLMAAADRHDRID